MCLRWFLEAVREAEASLHLITWDTFHPPTVSFAGNVLDIEHRGVMFTLLFSSFKYIINGMAGSGIPDGIKGYCACVCARMCVCVCVCVNACGCLCVCNY